MASSDSLKPKKTSSKDSLSPARQKAITNYRKQRRRVQQAVRRERNKGVAVNVKIPKISTKTAKTASIKQVTKQLQKITPQTIRELATDSPKDEELTEISKNLDEVEEKLNKLTQQYEPFNETGFDEKQRQQDEQNQERLRQDQEFADQFQKGEIVYNKIKSMIYEAYQAGMGEGHKLLESLLDEQIDTYGYDQEMQMIGQADETDLMQSAEIVCYDSDQNEVQFNLSRIAMLITGTIPSAQESAQMSDVQDQDSYTAPLT